MVIYPVLTLLCVTTFVDGSVDVSPCFDPLPLPVLWESCLIANNHCIPQPFFLAIQRQLHCELEAPHQQYNSFKRHGLVPDTRSDCGPTQIVKQQRRMCTFNKIHFLFPSAGLWEL